MEIKIFLTVWVLIVGLCIGSFLNVVILRGLSGESIVFPSSKCPVCGNKLKWWMNIPLLSYLLLKGKCGFCKTKISIQYPIIEATVGILFALIFYKFSYSIETIFYLIAVSFIVIMSVTDIKESIIFDIHAYLFAVFGLLFGIITGGFEGFITSLTGAVLGFILYEILARMGYLIAGQRAFGEGDSLIATGIGAFFGWKMMLFSIILSILVMSVFTLPYFFIRSYKQGKKGTVYALISSVFFIITVFCITKFDLIKDFASTIIFLIVSIVWAAWFIKQILDDVKQKKEGEDNGFCALPFGPAMGISFILIMFFAEQFEVMIKSYFS